MNLINLLYLDFEFNFLKTLKFIKLILSLSKNLNSEFCYVSFLLVKLKRNIILLLLHLQTNNNENK